MRGSFVRASSVVALALACTNGYNSPSPDASPASVSVAMNTLSAAERAAGWKLLFDGKSTAGWRAYNADTMPSGWQAVDGILTRVSRAADIITKDQYGDFELTLDWRL